jgi:catechol 2,3-dioxygenase-like lactoylglutathione lyase family enzyme
MTVSDMNRSVDFYTRVLGFTRGSDAEVMGEAYEELRDVFPVRMRVVRLQLGRELLELTEYLAPRGRPAPVDAQSNDRWFQHVAIVVQDMDLAYERLRAARVAHVSPAPQRLPDWNPNAGGIRAFYFRDPDGHPLELIWFPPGKGDPRWQEPGEALFLGIDHTAIASAIRARASPSTAIAWASASPAAARTTGPSRSDSTPSAAPACASRVCGSPRGPASSSSNTSRPATGGPFLPMRGPTIFCTGRRGSSRGTARRWRAWGPGLP